MKLYSRKKMLMPHSARNVCQSKWEKVSFTCTWPAANMPEVTNARSIDDQGTKVNKSADFADRLFSYTIRAQKYSIYSTTLFIVSLWSAHEDSFRGHFWGNHYLSIIKWIIRELSRNVNSPGTSSLPWGSVTAQHSLISLLLTHEVGEAPCFTTRLREVKWKLKKWKTVSAELSERLSINCLLAPGKPEYK